MRQSPDYIQVQLKTRFLTGSGIEQALRETGGEWQKRDGAEAWSKSLSPEQVNTLLAAIEHDPETTTLSAPRVMMFNGQRAFVMISTSTAYVGEVQRIKTRDGTNAFDPVIKTVNSGVVLDARVNVTGDGKSVALDLHPHVARLLSLEPVLATGGEAGKGPFIQVPRLSTATLHASTTVANDQTVVMRVTPKLKSGSAPATQPTTAADTPPTIILFNPSVIRPSR
jgi:hypothetical protein